MPKTFFALERVIRKLFKTDQDRFRMISERELNALRGPLIKTISIFAALFKLLTVSSIDRFIISFHPFFLKLIHFKFNKIAQQGQWDFGVMFAMPHCNIIKEFFLSAHRMPISQHEYSSRH